MYYLIINAATQTYQEYCPFSARGQSYYFLPTKKINKNSYSKFQIFTWLIGNKAYTKYQVIFAMKVGKIYDLKKYTILMRTSVNALLFSTILKNLYWYFVYQYKNMNNSLKYNISKVYFFGMDWVYVSQNLFLLHWNKIEEDWFFCLVTLFNLFSLRK